MKSNELSFNLKQNLCIKDGCFISLGKKRTKYCSKHHAEINHGRITSDKNDYIPNQIIKYNTYAEIIIFNKESKEICRTKIDLDDVEKCSYIRWRINNNGYIIKSVNTMLHNYVMCKDIKYINLDTDHIDHDKLNNRKDNLRFITRSENLFNRQIKGKGVYFNKQVNKYQAYIKINGINNYLGLYENEEDALTARDVAETIHYPNIRII